MSGPHVGWCTPREGLTPAKDRGGKMAKAQERIVPKTGKTVTKRTPAQRTATTRESWPSHGERKHGRGHPKTTAKTKTVEEHDPRGAAEA